MGAQKYGVHLRVFNLIVVADEIENEKINSIFPSYHAYIILFIS